MAQRNDLILSLSKDARRLSNFSRTDCSQGFVCVPNSCGPRAHGRVSFNSVPLRLRVPAVQSFYGDNAAMSARALSSVSSYSAAGSESATMPPPAWNVTMPSFTA